MKDHSCRVYVPSVGARADDRFDFRLIGAKEMQTPSIFPSFSLERRRQIALLSSKIEIKSSEIVLIRLF